MKARMEKLAKVKLVWILREKLQVVKSQEVIESRGRHRLKRILRRIRSSKKSGSCKDKPIRLREKRYKRYCMRYSKKTTSFNSSQSFRSRRMRLKQRKSSKRFQPNLTSAIVSTS